MRPAATVATVAALAVAAILCWRIVTVQMAETAVQSTRPDAATLGLRWDATHAEANYLDALQALRDEQADRARARLEAALSSDPTDGRSYALLALRHEAAGDTAGADRIMDIATRAAPRRGDVNEVAAGYWLRQGDVARAMRHYDVAMDFDEDARRRLFPLLLRLAEAPQARPAFEDLLKRPIRWWAPFFGYAADKSGGVDVLRTLFQLQSDGPNRAGPDGLRAYLRRLEREGLWLEAYFVWANSLDRRGTATIENLFNGDFEDPISNMGFDWRIDRADAALADAASTFGTTGSRSLRVTFRGPRIEFRHVRHHMMLGSAGYTLQGRVRLDALEAPQGIRWAVYCLGRTEPLGASEAFRGTDQWRRFAFQFAVPARDCEVQTLRLELVGRVPLDFEAKGTVWFDDLSVEQRRID